QHINTHTHARTQIFKDRQICTNTHTLTHTVSLSHTHTHTHHTPHTHTHTYTHTRTHTHTHTHTHTRSHRELQSLIQPVGVLMAVIVSVATGYESPHSLCRSEAHTSE